MLNFRSLQEKYQNSIAFRYLSIASIFLVVIQLVFGATQSYRLYQQRLDGLMSQAHSKLKIIENIAPEIILRSDWESLEELLQTLNEDKDLVYSVVFDKENKIAAQSIDRNNSTLNKLLVGQSNQDKNFLDIQSVKNLKSLTILESEIHLGDYFLGKVALVYSLDNTRKETFQVALDNLLSAIFISVLFAIMTFIIFNKEILYPLKDLKNLAKDIAGGKLEKRVTITRKDEIGELSNALNSMALQLQQTLNHLETARDEALIAEKAKSKFLAKMSHELRTPLNGIIGFTQIMQQDSTINFQQQENLNIIEQNGLHLLNLINDVLEMTYMDSGKSSFNSNSFDLYNLLQSLEQMFNFKAKEKSLKLLFQYGEKVPQYIETDEDKLRQILFNLLDNSIKFTSRGTITLKVKNQREEEYNLDSTLYFKVSDTGIGIPPEKIDDLFVAFAQTESGEKTSQGMGLGLPMSRQLVQLMGGDISIKSQVDKGTVVRFFIPVVEADITDINSQQYCATESEQSETESMESQFFYDRSSSYQLTDQKLASMDLEWLLALQDATTKVDNELIFQVLAKIPPSDQDLHQALMDLIDNFRYDAILELTDKALKH